MLAAWNLVDPGKSGMPKEMVLRFVHMRQLAKAEVLRLNATHSDTLSTYRKMGSPQYPTRAQVRALRAIAGLRSPEIVRIRNGKLRLEMLENELALIILK